MKPLFPAILAMACFLCACGQRAQLPRQPDCQTLHVILPGNFIIDLAADAEVILNPAAQEFELFCGADQAAQALASASSGKSLPEGSDWRVFIIEGSFSELAEACGEGRICLGQPARVTDWIAN